LNNLGVIEMKKLLTINEIAEMLSITPNAVYQQIHCGNVGKTIPPFVKVGKNVRFRNTDVETWLNELSAA